MEVMGLHLAGAAFVHPHDDLRHALTVAATHRAAALARMENALPIGQLLDERSFVNAIVGLHATGGSTNHTLHLPAMAAAAGIHLTWQDFADLSGVTPLLARVYPNGSADVNHFHAAGGIGFVIRELLDAGLLDGQPPRYLALFLIMPASLSLPMVRLSGVMRRKHLAMIKFCAPRIIHTAPMVA